MNSKSLSIQAKEASFHLLNHEVIAFPTETVMGLAVIYDDFEAYKLLNKIKRRPEDKPYTLMCGEISDLYKYAVIDERIEKIIKAFMPGSITIIVKAKEGLPHWVTHSLPNIGLRIPTNIEALAVLHEIKVALLVPSANRSGEAPALDSEQVKAIFKDEIAYIVDGKAKLDKPSTIVDLTLSEPLIIREGPITKEEILKIWYQ